MGKKKRLQMQQPKPGDNNEQVKFRQRDNPLKQTGKTLSLPANMEELEQQHAAWLARHGYAYISLAETARLWNRTPEYLIRLEQKLDENGD